MFVRAKSTVRVRHGAHGAPGVGHPPKLPFPPPRPPPVSEPSTTQGSCWLPPAATSPTPGSPTASRSGVLVPSYSQKSSDRMSSALPPGSLQWGKPSALSLSGRSQWEQDVLALLCWPDPASYFGARLWTGHGCPAGLLLQEEGPQAGLGLCFPRLFTALGQPSFGSCVHRRISM